MIFIDQINRALELNRKPQRVISLVPSITELVLDLGLGERLVGRTKFCIHPAEQVSNVKIIGGTKNVRLAQIKELKPDLILANKEENVQNQVLELAEEFPVYISDVKDVNSALTMIEDLGEILQLNHSQFTTEVIEAAKKSEDHKIGLGTALYVIWNNPIMAAGSDTFIHEMMKTAGFTNVILEARYPEVSEDALRALNPDVVLLSSEPFPFKEKHVAQFQTMLPTAKIRLVDGEMFSWYGSKMLKAYDYFQELGNTF